MSIEMVKSFYHDILKEVRNLEVEKRAIARGIRMLRGETERVPLIKAFLQADLDKHQLLEQATVAAMQNQVGEVLEQIVRLYPMASGPLIQHIRAEINREVQMLALICKELKHPDRCTFLERRVLRDIHKYVASQAREYAKIKT